MNAKNFAAWEEEFWGMNPGRRDLAILIRGGYVLVEYPPHTPPPSVPFWFPTRMVNPPCTTSATTGDDNGR